jgi:hypothetical protein
MARKKPSRPEVEAVRTYIEGVAKNLVDRLYGPDGPAWGTQLTELEDVALAVREALTEKMLAQALERQAATNEQRPEPYQNCPSCERPVTAEAPEPRLVQTRVGEAEWSEPQMHCRHCRRSFFPSVEESGD